MGLFTLSRKRTEAYSHADARVSLQRISSMDYFFHFSIWIWNVSFVIPLSSFFSCFVFLSRPGGGGLLTNPVSLCHMQDTSWSMNFILYNNFATVYANLRFIVIWKLQKILTFELCRYCSHLESWWYSWYHTNCYCHWGLLSFLRLLPSLLFFQRQVNPVLGPV